MLSPFVLSGWELGIEPIRMRLTAAKICFHLYNAVLSMFVYDNIKEVSRISHLARRNSLSAKPARNFRAN